MNININKKRKTVKKENKHFAIKCRLTSIKGIVKEISVGPITGPEDSRSLRLPNFETIGT
jgi:hypothetical protein